MMIKNSKIQWCGPSWNPWQGCVKKTLEVDGQTVLREECRFCYMYRDKKRYGQKPQVVIRSAPATFNKPLKIQREIDNGKRQRGTIDTVIFTCSWSDWFNPEADEWRPEAWEIIRKTPDLTYQILTKEVHRIGDHLPPFWDEIRGRVWLGYTCGMPGAEPLIDHLYGHGAAVRFLSCEPLFGYLDLSPYLTDDRSGEKIDWIITGGESGPKARPGHPAWYDHIYNLCWTWDIPFFFKQWGEWRPHTGRVIQSPQFLYMTDGGDVSIGGAITPDHAILEKIGTKKAGRLYRGREFNEFPHGYNFQS